LRIRCVPDGFFCVLNEYQNVTQFYTFDTHVATHLGTCTRIMSYVVRTMCVSNAYQMHSRTRYARYAYGTHMVRTWYAHGTHMVRIWYAFGTHTELMVRIRYGTHIRIRVGTCGTHMVRVITHLIRIWCAYVQTQRLPLLIRLRAGRGPGGRGVYRACARLWPGRGPGGRGPG
jgi:hypothetical protein